MKTLDFKSAIIHKRRETKPVVVFLTMGTYNFSSWDQAVKHKSP